MEAGINYWAVIVAAVASMIIGFLWYGPIFGKLWMSLMGITPESMQGTKKGMGARYAAMAVSTVVGASVLMGFIQLALVVDSAGALQLAFLIWLGFIATTLLGSVLWENRPIKLYILNISYHLVSLSAMTMILTYLS